MKLKFRLATITDLDRIMNVFLNAINEMKKNHIDQWDHIYPMKSLIEDDIKNKQLYIGLFEDTVASIYVLNQKCEYEYIYGEWKYPDSRYFIVHRFCVNPLLQNKGVGTQTMLNIEKELKKQNVNSIRLDAFALNPYAIKMYEKLNYLKVGQVHWRKGAFYLFEKKI